MPVLPTPVVAAQSTPLECDSFKPVQILLDFSGDVPKAAVVSLPYASNDGSPIFASKEHSITTKYANLVDAAARVPEIGPVLQAIAVATPALAAYMGLRQADVATAQARLDAAQQAVEAASAARNAAFKTPGWAAAEKAWNDAKVAVTAAQAVVNATVTALDPSFPPVTL